MASAFEKWLDTIWLPVNDPAKAASKAWDAALEEAAKIVEDRSVGDVKAAGGGKYYNLAHRPLIATKIRELKEQK